MVFWEIEQYVLLSTTVQLIRVSLIVERCLPVFRRCFILRLQRVYRSPCSCYSSCNDIVARMIGVWCIALKGVKYFSMI